MVLRVGEGKKQFEYRKRFIGRKSLTRKEGKCFKGNAEGRVCFTVKKNKQRAMPKKGWPARNFILNMIRFVRFPLSYHTPKLQWSFLTSRTFVCGAISVGCSSWSFWRFRCFTFFATGCFTQELVCSTEVMLAFCFIGPYWITGELAFSFERKAGGLLLGRCFYDENTLCSQDSLKWLLSGIELNMHKFFAFTCFLRAKAGALHFATAFYSRIGLLSHRRYASSLLFTCVYWMESERFAFVEGAFTREMPCSLGSL